MRAAAGPFDALPCGVVRCDGSGSVLSVNRRMLKWLSAEAADAWIGRPVHAILAPAGRIYFETHLRPMLAVDGRVSESALDLAGPPGARQPVYLDGRAERSEAGAVTGLVLVFTDGSHRALYERELRAQRKDAAAYQALVDASPDAIIDVAPDLTIMSWNRVAEALLGHAAADALGAPAHPLIIPDDKLQEARDALAAVAEGRHVRIETTRLHRDGTHVPVELNVAAIRDEGGAVVGTAGILRDIRERRRQEARIRTLNAELGHRAQNVLSVVSVMARHTFGKAVDPGPLADFEARLGSLAVNQSMLVHGAADSLDLHELIRAQLRHLAPSRTARLALSGPSMGLRKPAADAIGMAVFELSTNALKHGALSVPAGRLAITTALEAGAAGPVLRLGWRESGVAMPDAPPTREGFGSRLTGRLLEAAVGGTVDRTFEADGLRWTLSVEAARVAATPDGS